MWMKVDDGLHAHRKTRAVTKSAPDKVRDAAPMGLWVLAGSWSAQNNTDGWVPRDELDRFDDEWQGLAARLVRAGYWWPAEHNGEAGFGFNDWLDYNPESEAASRSGSFGNHVRWHINKGVVNPECEHCPNEPESDENHPDSGGDIGGRSGGESGSESRSIALPGPTRPQPDPTRPLVPAMPDERDDVERLCTHLADRIEANGSKRPPINKGWRTAARLMLDNDKRSEEQVHAAIDWCQRDEFWRGVVLSMPKLRTQYEAMRLQAERRRPASRQQETDDLFDRAAQRLGIGGDR